MKRILLVLLFVPVCLPIRAQLFTQDFSSSTIVNTYVSSTPNNTQFTSISSLANNPSSIIGGALRFTKAGNNTGHFARNTEFSGPPTLLQLSFDFKLSGNSNVAVQNTQATFFVGTSLGDGATDPSNPNVHSKFAFSFNSTDGSFFVRKLTTPANSANSYTGKQTITFIVNNSGSTKTYTSPAGATESIADDKWDLFVGNVKEFDDISAITSAVDLSAFRFSYPASSENAIVDIDNIQINELTTLPISLTTFTAKPIDETILLNWKTASEKDSKYFDLQRSADGKSYTSITTIDGAGSSNTERNYSFTDENPFAGTNYYKLFHYDYDGKSSSKVIVADSKLVKTQVFASATSSSIDLNIFSPNTARTKIFLYDLEGSKLAEKDLVLGKGHNACSFPESLSPGVYFVSLITEGLATNVKFAKW